jgi:iron complex outermembrane recepter protein
MLGSAMAQFSISGKVSTGDGEQLAGANVVLSGTYLGTITGNSGDFRLTGLKPGTYQLRVSFLGFETVDKLIQLTGNQQVDFVLVPAVVLAEEVVVKAYRAGNTTPASYTNISGEKLSEGNMGQDMPLLLQHTPSLVSTSDAGNGMGYSSFRIRGSDLTRINVTVNGVPLNDAESHGVWWVDLPDFAGSVENVQLQRGVGTSTNGAAAFGASVNFRTMAFSREPYAEIEGSMGTFNSYRKSVKFGTGLIADRFAFDGRLSASGSDGFIDRASSRLSSWFFSGGYFAPKTIIKFITFSGKERTYQAWNGIPRAKMENDTQGMLNYIEGMGLDSQDSAKLFNSGSRTYNLYTYRNQVDDYTQDHYQLHLSHEFSPALFMNAALHYTAGYGYYEQFEKKQAFSDYGLNDIEVGSDSIIHYEMGVPQGYFENGAITSTDLIRRKWLDNDFYGITWSLDYSHGSIEAQLGGAWNTYDGRHHGNIIWSQFVSNGDMDYEWYHSTGLKKENNLFARLNYSFDQHINLFADLQYRHIDYTIEGMDDNKRNIGQHHRFDFVNPKFGLQVLVSSSQRAYLTFGIANREPSRSNYTDADQAKPMPVNETLRNLETGYEYTSRNVRASANMFLMNYRNQLVLTGDINDVGDPVMTNVLHSYRAGAEFTLELKVNSLLSIEINSSLSRNRILNFTEYVDNWDYWSDPVNEPYQVIRKLGETNLAFSPQQVSSCRLDIRPIKPLLLSLQSCFVGKQYIDNTSSSDRMLRGYAVSNLLVEYNITAKRVKQIDLQFMINNLLNARYSSNAWVYRYRYGGEEHNLDGYFPQAGIHFMAGVSVKF